MGFVDTATSSTYVLHSSISAFIGVTFFLSFVIVDVYRNFSPPRNVFKSMKAISAGTFFSYGQICLQKHGVEIYQQRFFGIQSFYLWVQPLVFVLLVVFESNYFCLFHVRSPGSEDSVRYAPLVNSDNLNEIELDSSRHGELSDEENDNDSLSEGDDIEYRDDDGEFGELPDPSYGLDVLSPRNRRKVEEKLLVDEMRSRLAEEGGFPLLPTLCVACLEAFATGFEVGDISSEDPQYVWTYVHLLFSKAMLSISWASLLQARLGEPRKSLMLASMTLLAAATPLGILAGQLYHKVDSSALRQPIVLDTIFCAASGMYMYLACFPLGEDWKQRKLSGVIAAAAVAIISNVYLEE